MNSKYLFAALGIAVLLFAVLLILHIRSRRASGGRVVHVENSFEFTVQAPIDRAAPLFGAWAERAWAGEDWKPHFLYPQPARDVAGEVFTVSHGGHHSIWVNTALDLQSGHMQYVYVMPAAQAVLIDVHLHPVNATTTAVNVMYQRTSLNSQLNDHITELGRQDSKNGPVWQSQINRYFQQHPAPEPAETR